MFKHKWFSENSFADNAETKIASSYFELWLIWMLLFDCYRSGTLAADYEKKKAAMQKAEEDTTFNYHKKKVIKLATFCGGSSSSTHSCFTTVYMH